MTSNNKKVPSIGDKIMVYSQDSAQPVSATVLKKRISVRDSKMFYLIRTPFGEEWRSEDTIFSSSPS